MNTNLIDMFGLSGDHECDDRLEDLLARWEEDIENSSAEYFQSGALITVAPQRNTRKHPAHCASIHRKRIGRVRPISMGSNAKL